MRVFVTGASGHLASAIVPDLIAAGHEVTGLARSDAAAAAVTALGAALEGTGKPLVGTSGTLAVAGLGRPGTEQDAGNPGGRTDGENVVLGLAERGVRSSVVRVPPITHSTLDRHGFARTLIAIAQRTGVAGYPGDGANRWPAGHTLDVGLLYRLALEDAPAGTRWHAAGDEGLPVREIAESIGAHLGLPAASIPAAGLQAHFGFLAGLIVLDGPVTTERTRRILGWEPVHPGLLADFDEADYF
jgi:nucleoside-diphosphate-sugar epimerase